ncbi:MAG: N-6 DNA methylase [Phycisphaerales bacterium]|nr:N-6 DNA methylase [Phycisphaerales bacterium]
MEAKTRLLRYVRNAVRRDTNPGDLRGALLQQTAQALFGDKTPAPALRFDGAIDPTLERLTLAVIANPPDRNPLELSAELLECVHEQLATTDGVGVHYTPAGAARYMAQSALAECIAIRRDIEPAQAMAIMRGDVEIPTRDRDSIRRLLDGIRICDPACGAGRLLIAAAETLAQVHARLDNIRRDDDADMRRLRARIATQQLFGADIDERAIAIARLRLGVWAAGAPDADIEQRVSGNVVVSDTLQSAPTACDLDSAFDIILMNPPYVPTYSRRSRSDLRAPIRAFAGRRGLTGRLNLFGCFILRSLEMTAANGVVSFIVPDTFASAGAYTNLRRSVSDRFNRQHWARIDDRVFKAQVGSVILTASRATESLSASVLELSSKGPHSVSARTAHATRGDDAQILFFDSPFEMRLWGHIREAAGTTLDAFAEVRDGVNTGPRRMRDVLLAPTPASAHRRLLIEGGDIDPRGYLLRATERTILYDPSLVDDAARRAGASLRDPAIFNAPKVVTRQTADTLIAALEAHGGLVALNSVHCIRLRGDRTTQLPGLMALLNSPLVRLFYALDGGEQRSVLPQVRIAWLNALPVPTGFDALLARLTPIGAGVLACLKSGASSTALIREGHDYICDAYAVPPSDRAPIIDAYLRRFPRFADAMATAPRRRRARVA